MHAYDPIHLFERAAQRWSDRPALRVEGRSITYGELDAWSNAIAERLVARCPDAQRVAFAAEKRASSYASVLGILKAGMAYVPLPPDGPRVRWRSMVDLAGVKFTVGAVDLPGLEAIDAAEGAASRSTRNASGQEAYVLFTSGSTGGPKGVSVSRANVAAYLEHQLNAHAFTEQDRFSQFFALTFDLSVHDLFICWSVGGCLCVPSANDLMRAATFVREEGITVWFSVPSLVLLLQRMRALPANALHTVRLAFFCGEPLTWPIARAYAAAAPEAELFNLYGPTEATIAITSYRIARVALQQEGVVPIGVPFKDARVRVVDDELQLSGPQLAAGYVGNADATDRAFLVDPATGERWYRTGDHVRYDAEENLHFVSRLDDQVKIMGHRVEPAEVDAALASLVPNGHALTLAKRTGDSVRLYTFIDTVADHSALMHELRRTLPAYMLPERIITVEVMPMTAHGKLDRKALLALIEHG
ncbi:MAG: amino acid adenylation domain-containing protein [Flavobacteriales bacterium]|nr:amino acid adenylation domain-containing protein [Flavobacteriales bacterium]